MLVEEQVRVENLDEQVQVLWLGHADLGGLEGFAQLGHHLVTLLLARAEVQVGGQVDRLCLQVLFQ